MWVAAFFITNTGHRLICALYKFALLYYYYMSTWPRFFFKKMFNMTKILCIHWTALLWDLAYKIMSIWPDFELDNHLSIFYSQLQMNLLLFLMIYSLFRYSRNALSDHLPFFVIRSCKSCYFTANLCNQVPGHILGIFMATVSSFFIDWCL